MNNKKIKNKTLTDYDDDDLAVNLNINLDRCNRGAKRKDLDRSPPEVFSSTPWERSGRPKAQRAQSCLDFLWDENEGRSIPVRDRQGSALRALGEHVSEAHNLITGRLSLSPDERQHLAFISSMRRLKREITGMANIVLQNRNTKTEIKEAAEELNSIVSVIWAPQMRRIWEHQCPRSGEKEGEARMCEDVSTQTSGSFSNPVGVEIGTQVGEGNISLDGMEVDDERAQLENAVAKGGGCDDFITLLERKWPRVNLSRISGVVGQDILKSTRDWDLGALTPRYFTLEEKGPRRLLERFQGAADLRAQEKEAGEVAYLAEGYKFPAKDGGTVERTRMVFFGLPVERQWDPSDIKGIFQSIEAIREVMKREGRGRVAFVAPYKIASECFRRILEFVFYASGIEVKVFLEGKGLPGSAGGARAPLGRDKGFSGKSFREEAVIIRVGEGNSFAEVLQEMKREVNIRENGVAVSSVRKTRSGDILLAVKRVPGQEMAKRLRTVLEDKMGGRVMDVRSERAITLHIGGMDGVTTKAELEAALKIELGGGLWGP